MINELILKLAIENAFGDCTEEYAKSQIDRDGGYRVIFSHPFAKAFARYLIIEREHQARELLGIGYMPYVNIKEDLEHYVEKVKKIILLQMVLEKEPLLYLVKFLEEV